jgi:hypothetical protein
MTATITDKIMVASSGTRPNPTTLTAQKSVGASLLNADDLTGWGTSTPVTFVLYKIDSNGNEIVGSRTDWKGIVSGNTITQLTLTAGTDTIYPAGSPVIAAATARWADDLTAATLVSLNQNGTLKDNSVGNTTITDGSVSTAKVADGAVTGQKLATNAITLGKSTSFTSFSTSSAADVQATGATLTVTVPSGGRDVEIILDNIVVTNTVGVQYVSLSLWEGTVGSGTLLARKYWVIPNAGGLEGASIAAQHTPSAGSHTYNVGVQVQSGTGGYNTYSGQILKARLV